LQALKAGDVLAMLGLAASTFLLIVKAIQPTTLQITIDGQSIQTQQIPIIYTPADIAVIAASAFIMGVSLHHILTSIALKPAQPPTPQPPVQNNGSGPSRGSPTRTRRPSISSS
jgi:hypothetical protein